MWLCCRRSHHLLMCCIAMCYLRDWSQLCSVLSHVCNPWLCAKAIAQLLHCMPNSAQNFSATGNPFVVFQALQGSIISTFFFCKKQQQQHTFVALWETTAQVPTRFQTQKTQRTLHKFCVSSLHRSHVTFLCAVYIFIRVSLKPISVTHISTQILKPLTHILYIIWVYQWNTIWL